MDEAQQSPSSGVGAGLRRAAPPPALCGFLLLLVLIFAVSYAVGVGAGPVAPGMRGDSTSRDGGEPGGHGGGGMGDMDGMQGGHG
ncbi:MULTISPECIES: hypothetical protein [Streptomyces]|uniref:Uncharacterized protein n=1 Tax=Streptomyces koelreuteriae TaxID=2838015 RepID=A0ABX8G3Y1_9ACTN|nr:MULTISPECIES: hypothetical protein [Streptomyces]QWB28061.1 hypothetical protein KJK29_00760 [Streptomyces koelreuteriae]UUA11170.1 hypothetical protein NNW98_00760 [Streptomyces koelreuteriae]UUA18774.1 hypothetical protein NNW99_00760 [Streptomyces sp. CRCS-T-1]